jgi:hypothetical protein
VLCAAPVFAAAPPQPFTLTVGAWATCAPGSHDVRRVVEADVAEMRRVAGAGQDSLANPTETELKRRLAELAGRGALRQGLVVVYSGHGVATHPTALDPPPDAPASPPGPPPRDGTSHLCLTPTQSLPSGWLKVEILLEWLDALRPALPWAVLVLNACESAFVDVSRTALPVSVISASPYPVTVHFGQGNAAASELVRATTEAIAQPAAHDRNRDGVLDDSELLAAIRSLVAGWRPLLGSPGRPWAKLRRQAPAALPVRRHQQFPVPEPALVATIEKLRRSGTEAEELVSAIEAQLALAQGGTTLPALDWDFVMEEGGPARKPDGPAGSAGGPAGQRAAALAARSDLRALPGGGALAAEEVERLAGFMTFADIYAVSHEDPWTEILRLGDRRLMSTTRARSLGAALPARMAVQARWQNGYWLVRATRAVVRRGDRACWSDGLCTKVAETTFALCREEEGQCFMVK